MADKEIPQKRERVKPLTQEYIKSILDYDPETGVFLWRYRNDVPRAWNTRWARTIAGNVQHGYRIISINYTDYRAHVLAWCYMTGEWPPHDIDHRDLNRSNNIFTNLRGATRSENLRNGPKRTDNTSGYKGVSFTKGKYWRARIHINKVEVVLGYFLNKEDAAEAYADAIEKHYNGYGRIE